MEIVLSPSNTQNPKTKIAIMRAVPEESIAALRAKYDVQVYNVGPDTGGDEARVIEVAQGASALLSVLDNPITARVMEACPDLRIIAQCAVGYDNIDIEAARTRGIVVSHTPGVLTEATADFTLALLLSVARQLREADLYVRAGRFKRWETMLLHGMGLQGKTLGIIGLGRIGRAVAHRARSFGMQICYHNRRQADPDVEHQLEAPFLSLEALLQTSDIVTLHCPLNKDSRHLLDAKAFRLMKPTALLLNTARGPIIDEDALVDALKAGELAGAGLDVFEREPAVHPGLLDQDRVLLAPHLASATVEARTAMARMCAEAIEAALTGADVIPHRVV